MDVLKKQLGVILAVVPSRVFPVSAEEVCRQTDNYDIVSLSS
jgi:hypothetical protein